MKLTQGRLKELLDYAPKTGVFTWINSPSKRVKPGDVAGTINITGYRYIKIDGKKYRASRLAWFYMEGYFPEHQVDHEDRDKLNNKWENLRHVTSQCNIRNTGNRNNNTSGVKGVYWHKPLSKWAARVGVNYKIIHLGCYDNFDDAVKARYNKEKELGWRGCESNSPAYEYLKKNGLL